MPSAFLTHHATDDGNKFYQGLEKTCGLRVQPWTGRESLVTNFFGSISPLKTDALCFGVRMVQFSTALVCDITIPLNQQEGLLYVNLHT